MVKTHKLIKLIKCIQCYINGVTMVVKWKMRSNCYFQWSWIFNDCFPYHPIDRHYFRELVDKLFETGRVQNKKRSGALSTTEEKKVQIMGEFIVNLFWSSKIVALTCEVHKWLHPYKLNIVYELEKEDPDRRLQHHITYQLFENHLF